MAVGGVRREPVYMSNSLITGKIQGNSAFSAGLGPESNRIHEGYRACRSEFPVVRNREILWSEQGINLTIREFFGRLHIAVLQAFARPVTLLRLLSQNSGTTQLDFRVRTNLGRHATRGLLLMRATPEIGQVRLRWNDSQRRSTQQSRSPAPG